MHEQPRRVDPRGHVGEAEGDGLVLGDRLAELLARLRVLDRVLERRPRDPRGGGPERDPRPVERAHEPVEALPFVAEPPVLGQLGVLEEHLRVHDRALPHLPHRLAERDPRIALLDDEGRDPREREPGSTVAKTT